MSAGKRSCPDLICYLLLSVNKNDLLLFADGPATVMATVPDVLFVFPALPAVAAGPVGTVPGRCVEVEKNLFLSRIGAVRGYISFFPDAQGGRPRRTTPSAPQCGARAAALRSDSVHGRLNLHH